MTHWALRVARSTIFSIGAEVLARTANTVFFVLLTWYAGETEASYYSIGFVYSTLLLPFVFAGFDQLLSRESARNRELAPRLLGNLLIARVVAALLCYLGLLVWLVYQQDYTTHSVLVIALLGATIIPDSLTNLYQGYLFAFERVHYITLIGAVTGVLKLVAGLIVLGMGQGAVQASLVVLAASFLALVLHNRVVSQRIGPPVWSLDWNVWSRFFAPAVVFYLISVFITIEASAGPLLLSLRYDPVAVGTYAAAANLIALLNIVPLSFRQAILPILTSIYASTPEQAVRVVAQSLRLLLITTLLIALSLSFLVDLLVPILYQGHFTEAIPVLITLIWGFVFTCCAIPHGRLIVVANHQNVFVPLHFTSMAINLLLTLLLLPAYGVMGVAVANLVSTAFIFLAGVVYVQLRLQRWPVARAVRGPLVAAALLLVSALLLRMVHVPLLLALGTGWILYGVTLWGLRVLSHEDVRWLQQLVRRRAVSTG